MKVKITIGDKLTFIGSFNETVTAQKIYESLPITGEGNIWGGEIYFVSQVTSSPEDNARDVLQAGEIAYWPPLKAICLFYGPTPASQGGEIRAAGPVNIVGKITGDLSPLKQVKGMPKVLIEKQL
ncbi:MAG: cyclophilin-like fold protein [Dethiobacteria bacterium]